MVRVSIGVTRQHYCDMSALFPECDTRADCANGDAVPFGYALNVH
jgi:hypothetical protein